MSPTDRVHRVPTAARRLVEEPLLHLDGLVARPVTLSAEDLASLPRVDLRETFTCDTERAARGQTWRGIRVGDVVALALAVAGGPLRPGEPGGFVIPIALEESASALLCDTLDGEPLTVERGALWRLVVPGGRCFTSVKWVNHLELAAEPGRDTGERIVRAQQRRAAAAAGEGATPDGR